MGTSDLARERPVRISCGIELKELLHTMTVVPPRLLCADMKREKTLSNSNHRPCSDTEEKDHHAELNKKREFGNDRLDSTSCRDTVNKSADPHHSYGACAEVMARTRNWPGRSVFAQRASEPSVLLLDGRSQQTCDSIRRELLGRIRGLTASTSMPGSSTGKRAP